MNPNEAVGVIAAIILIVSIVCSVVIENSRTDVFALHVAAWSTFVLAVALGISAVLMTVV